MNGSVLTKITFEELQNVAGGYSFRCRGSKATRKRQRLRDLANKFAKYRDRGFNEDNANTYEDDDD